MKTLSPLSFAALIVQWAHASCSSSPISLSVWWPTLCYSPPSLVHGNVDSVIVFTDSYHSRLIIVVKKWCVPYGSRWFMALENTLGSEINATIKDRGIKSKKVQILSRRLKKVGCKEKGPKSIEQLNSEALSSRSYKNNSGDQRGLIRLLLLFDSFFVLFVANLLTSLFMKFRSSQNYLLVPTTE
jgi:hypothetical protein